MAPNPLRLDSRSGRRKIGDRSDARLFNAREATAQAAGHVTSRLAEPRMTRQDMQRTLLRKLLTSSAKSLNFCKHIPKGPIRRGSKGGVEGRGGKACRGDIWAYGREGGMQRKVGGAE